MTLQKIISGGQTGADQGGLEAGEALGIPTGGFIPKGFRTADGPRPDLAERFGLVEHSAWGYPPRTKTNVVISDMTICFGNLSSPGSRLTKRYCEELGKSFRNIPYNYCSVEQPVTKQSFIKLLVGYIKEVSPEVINIAGNREEKNPGIQEFTKRTLIEVLKQYVG